MNKTWETKLQRLWLFISATSLLLPILLYFDTNATINFATAITASLVVLFAVSLPSSLFALPLVALFKYGIELDLDSMFGAYFYLIFLNIVGYVQWFWLMLKFNNSSKPMTLPTILEN